METAGAILYDLPLTKAKGRHIIFIHDPVMRDSGMLTSSAKQDMVNNVTLG